LKSPKQWGEQGAERCGRLRRRDEGGAEEGVRCKKRKKETSSKGGKEY